MEKVIIVGCQFPQTTDEQFQNSMDECSALVQTAEGEVVTTLTQKRTKKEPSTYIGKGKLEELKNLESMMKPDCIIFNDELSPSQQSNLAHALEARVIDRTQLILDIFAQRAHSKEGQLQVELAQLKYMLPRLSGMGIALSRLGGGIGTRGPGETQLETDRRYIRRRITDIESQLSVIVKHRERYRERRKRNEQFQIALVGYTNAGKSTLFNRLTDAEAFAENKLFATLDPLTRKFRLSSGFTVLLTDTVGFIQQLPTALIAAFRSTLEEVREADLFIHVIDASNEDAVQHEKTVHEVLEQLEAAHIPMVTFYNKKDLVLNSFIQPTVKDALFVSVKDDEDLKKIHQFIQDKIMEQLVPFKSFISIQESTFLNRVEKDSLVLNKEWDEKKEGYRVTGYVKPETQLYGELTNQ